MRGYLRGGLFGVLAGALLAQAQPAATEQPAAADLGEVFKDTAKWALSSDAFMGEFQSLGFSLVDGKQTAMSNQKQMLRFLGLEVCEARVYFDQTAVRRVELSVYKKGEAGAKDKEAFEGLVTATKDKIVAFSQDTGMSGKTSNDRPNYFVKRHQ